MASRMVRERSSINRVINSRVKVSTMNVSFPFIFSATN